MTAKEEAFHKDMLAIYDKIRHATDYRPNRFLPKVKRSGGVASAKYWLALNGVSKGFKRLEKEGKLEFSVEALVVRPEYKELFTDAEKAIALDRLKGHGWTAERAPESEDTVKAHQKNISFWIFQAVPKHYALKKELMVRKGDWWQVSHFRKQMKKGDKAILWQAGKESGIYGVGELEGIPYQPANSSDWRVDIKFTHQFNPPIFKDQLLKHKVLKTIRILKPPFQGTNFKATEDQWNALGIFDDRIHADEVEAAIRYPEGATVQRTVNAYERNPQARQKCLEHYGYSCSVCLTNFEERYGELGRACTHVHHLKMMSQIGRKYEVDPIKDLRPVCPNCHAMIHWKGQMLGIEDLRDLLKKKAFA